jgi:hypothetical protein
VEWLDKRVVAAGRGDELDRLEVDPSATFWLGRLASEDEVQRKAANEMQERLGPCAIGIRLRPAGGPPWQMTVTVRARGWVKDGKDGPDPDRPWWRTGLVEESLALTVDERGGSFGADQLAAAFAVVGAPGLRAEVRIDVEDWHRHTELVIQLVNVSPEKLDGGVDSRLYETQIEVSGVDTVPFQLEALPDSFRYERDVPAFGVNVGVEVVDPGVFRSTDTVSVQTERPEYWNSSFPESDLSFRRLATDPLPELQKLIDALAAYDEEYWSASALDARQAAEGWTHAMRTEADHAADAVFEELNRLRAGLTVLREHPTVLRAFQLMNEAIERSARGRFRKWRPFQVGFLLATVRFLVEPEDEARFVDTVWFATGGGKTETYLGLLLTAAFHDRLTGKVTGVTAWSRFPLRLLSLQQTQRFADAIAAAELVRQENKVGGLQFSLGFLVGKNGTPNKISPLPGNDDVTPSSPGMPEAYRVLLRCPFCHDENLRMAFNRARWTLEHVCTNERCSMHDRALPVYVVDQEIFRFLPTVVVGTLDKAASVGLQQAMRGLVGPPHGLCSQPWHGFTYAVRKKAPNGCLVPDCGGSKRKLPMDERMFAPSLRLQDELHLLRDSLGAVDSHYESLLDHLQAELGSRPAKIVASSATLTGYQRQIEVLYRREGRVFPQPGPRPGESFWAVARDQPLRRYVAVAPRGVTLEHVSDRTMDALQRCIRELLEDPERVCAAAGVARQHANTLASLYGTNVVYGNTLYDVEAAARSVGSNNTVGGINVEQLTGQTELDAVRATLDRLEHPEEEFDDRIHVIAASSMLSHGVDVDRLNTMVMLGLPVSAAEFIQTTARVGRRFPGLVYVLHKIARERDAQTFRQFDAFVTQGDRFVDAIPITRRSRRVLELTLPGMVGARTLMIHEPDSGTPLTTPDRLRKYVRQAGLTPEGEAAEVAELLGLRGPDAVLHEQQIARWLEAWFGELEDPTSRARFLNELGPTKPMTSLRDVEETAPIRDLKNDLMTILGRRSGSQILRTFLPEQTVDLSGGIYRVTEWVSPSPIDVDIDMVRGSLQREAMMWKLHDNDSGLHEELQRGARVDVVELDRAHGVRVERYPLVWVCHTCKRIGDSSTRCRCGHRSWRQLHFVGIHDCGAILEPYVKRCRQHDDVRIVIPKSAKVTDIVFECPTCGARIAKGLSYLQCRKCGEGQVRWNVHKARSVYSPCGMVLINPPRPEHRERLKIAGGGRKALNWVLEGLQSHGPGDVAAKQTREELITSLRGFPPEMIQSIVENAERSGVLARPGDDPADQLDADTRKWGEHDAVDIAMALAESRKPASELCSPNPGDSLDVRYRERYPQALTRAGVAGLDFVDKFPVLTAMYGFTRGDGDPSTSRLLPFRRPKRDGFRLYGELAETEAYLIRLDPIRVANWLLRRGHQVQGWFLGDEDPVAARVAILRSTEPPNKYDDQEASTAGADLLRLVHTYAHRFIRQTAVLAGIDRDALSEYLVPRHLAFFMYASARGGFVLGGLQAVFESTLDELLDAVVDAEHRCALDPGCSRGSGACHACVHLGEPSCRFFNRFLDRGTLFGADGYLRAQR